MSCYLIWVNFLYLILGWVLGWVISFFLRGLLSDFKFFLGLVECVLEFVCFFNLGVGIEVGWVGCGLLEKSFFFELVLLLKLENCWLMVFLVGFIDVGFVGLINCWYCLVNDVKVDCGLFGFCFYGNKKI